MPEFNCQDRISLFARLNAGAMFVDAGPRDKAVVDVQPYDDTSASREAAERTLVEMRGSALHVESPEQGWRIRRSGRIRVDIHLPEDSIVNVRLASADGRFEGRYGDTAIDSGSGDVTVGQVAGTLRIRTGSADVHVGQVEGPGSVASGSGDVVIGYVAADVAVDTASGDITVDRADGSMRARSASGDVRVGAVRRGNVELTTISGDVRLGIPAGTSVWLDLSTASGSTRSDLDHGGTPPTADAAPDLNLRVRTASGDIELRRVPAPAAA
jgi:DUF4097 and DUF4098 domain-containing protein YvlB